MNEQTDTSLNAELKSVEQQVVALGRLVEQQLADVLWILNHPNRALKQQIYDQLVRQEKAAEDCELELISIVARHPADIMDLRHVLAAFRIVSDLKQAGRLSSSIAQHLLEMSPDRQDEDTAGSLHEMVDLAQIQLRDACRAFETRDLQHARRALAHGDAISSLQSILFKEILQGIAEDHDSPVDLVNLLYVVKNIEKISDHATSIASSLISLCDADA
ncbi:phosphate uptake regulator PhoU [Stenotrophomonas sp. SY1]|uniref:phosphate signaling complex PhoU family protein n=1 Tax=Stenotrophomonas sp. SY1 TaxID=477235 RepID=UPI001E315330|nr:phosphate uptake regulator PhoU [Stenotrophomonas sp. SY1]MCD9085205.1 phosphate uptake regulator PhoU [Stenotrophomonas sp. SY1]